MIKLICNTTLTTSLKFGYRLIHNNQVMIEKGKVYTGDIICKYIDWEDYCKVNEEVWITEIKQWIEVKYFNDITEYRDIQLNELINETTRI